MNAPKKIETTFSSRRREPELMAEVQRIFHDWLRLGVLDDVLIDVADYRHVAGGPGFLLIGHECNYRVRLTETGVLEARCSQKRAFANGRCPVAETFTRGVKICRMLEEHSGRTRLFDCSRVRVAARDRLSTRRPGFSIEEFAWHVRQSLSRELFTVPQVKVRSDREFPLAEVKWVAERTMQGLDERAYHPGTTGAVG